MVDTATESMDPRIRRTRQLLHRSLENLLKKKEFDKISIQDIAKGATVNRVTFYDHYPDKFALARVPRRQPFSGAPHRAQHQVRQLLLLSPESDRPQRLRLSGGDRERQSRAAPRIGRDRGHPPRPPGRPEAASPGCSGVSGDDCGHPKLGDLRRGAGMAANTKPLFAGADSRKHRDAGLADARFDIR